MSAAIAVLGASGFIGSRIVEKFHLGGGMDVRPIVRSAARLAGAARFALDGRIADGFDRAALAAAFVGSEAVVHVVAGDRRTILGTAEAAYRAAQDVGVKRLVYLSSASVHGQDPAPGTDERSPLDRRQPIPYNRAKIDAEALLMRLRSAGSVELVILRPGIVYGPRSSWTGGLADEVLSGEACLVDGGRGICNALYVDNLVHGVELALSTPGIDGEAFLLGEDGTITWRDFYRPIVEALGFEIERIPTSVYRPDSAWRRWSRTALSTLPEPARSRLRVVIQAMRTSKQPASLVGEQRSVVTLEKAMLHRCRTKLPWTKAQERLGYRPPVGFGEGCRRSVAWLAYADYPIVVRG